MGKESERDQDNALKGYIHLILSFAKSKKLVGHAQRDNLNEEEKELESRHKAMINLARKLREESEAERDQDNALKETINELMFNGHENLARKLRQANRQVRRKRG